jgi:hypothetical protein
LGLKGKCRWALTQNKDLEKNMYARITPYKMKSGSKDEAVVLLDTVKGDILKLPGMVQFINVMNDDGSGYIVSLSSNADTPPETQVKIQAIWATFSDILEAIPTPENFEVVADWKP